MQKRRAATVFHWTEDGVDLQTMLFDGWEPLGRTLLLGVLAYVALVLVLRVSGKRTLSKMNAFDFVVTVALGSTLAAVFTARDISLAQGVVALALLVGLQFVNTFLAVRWPAYQRLLKAQPSLVFFRGRPLDEALHRQRLTRDEVLEAIRQQGHARPEQVDAVVLETEGSLSVLKGDAASLEVLDRLGVEIDAGDADQPASEVCPHCGRSGADGTRLASSTLTPTARQ